MTSRTTVPDSVAPREVGDGRYAVGEEIGAGGAARVYRARDRLLRRDVAVKVFRACTVDPDDLRVQEAEAKVVASLNHYALTTLFDVGADETDPEHPRIYLVMEHIPGSDLRRRLRRGPLPALQVAYLGFDLADGLAYLHEAGFLHRDVKPANVLLASRGEDVRLRGKLADFGISSIIGAGDCDPDAVTGTAAYLSPEQVAGEEAVPASDVYSLGLVLLEAMTGRIAFPGGVEESALARLDHDPAIPASVPDPFATVLRRMLARQPSDRPLAAAAAAQLQEVVLDGLLRRRSAAPPPEAEAQRLEAVHRYQVLDTPPEDAFDEVTALVSRVLRVPVALVAVVGDEDVSFKSRRGVEAGGVPRSVTAEFAETGPAGTWNIPDVLAVPSLRAHPFVAGAPFVRSALAAPLVTHDGHAIGRILACDLEPRAFRDDEVETLEAFARIVMRELELRLAGRRALFAR